MKLNKNNKKGGCKDTAQPQAIEQFQGYLRISERQIVGGNTK